MLPRVALFIATLAAALVLAIGISVATGSAVADTVGQVPQATTGMVDGGSATPRVQVDTVYVPAPVKPQTITVHRTVRSARSGEGEHEREGGDE